MPYTVVVRDFLFLRLFFVQTDSRDFGIGNVAQGITR